MGIKKIPIVTNVYDLKEYVPKQGKIGYWCVSADLHEGHLALYEVIKKHCDFIIGCYFTNYYQVLTHVTGHDPQMTLPFQVESMLGMIDRVDVLHLNCHDHIPYDRHTPYCINEKQLPTESLPEHIRNCPRTLALLRTAISCNRKIWKVTGYNFHAGCIKDYWRPYAAMWQRKYLGQEYIITEPEKDQYGNNFSSSYSKWQEMSKQTIDFPLLTQEILTREDLESHLKKHGIKDLNIADFAYDKNVGYTFARFNGYNLYWHESRRVECL